MSLQCQELIFAKCCSATESRYHWPVAKKRPVYRPKLAEFLVALRVQKGWKQAEALHHATRRKLDLTEQTLRGLEDGTTRYPSPEALRVLAKLYAVSYDGVVAKAIEEIYGVHLAPSDFDVGEAVRLKAERDNAVARAVLAEKTMKQALTTLTGFSSLGQTAG